MNPLFFEPFILNSFCFKFLNPFFEPFVFWGDLMKNPF
ncbi:hypothetical protein HPHPA8_1100 [Helicobacter pylori Hp A-8]|nr:hypothetical protein HPHPA8_1100 [Helicobacter pylori Hp A-8]